MFWQYCNSNHVYNITAFPFSFKCEFVAQYKICNYEPTRNQKSNAGPANETGEIALLLLWGGPAVLDISFGKLKRFYGPLSQPNGDTKCNYRLFTNIV